MYSVHKSKESLDGQRTDYWSELAQLIVAGATDGRFVCCQRQLTVDNNTEVTSGVRDGDAGAEHQDVTAVNCSGDAVFFNLSSSSGSGSDWEEVCK